jgi:general L-amino acid transport system substrate-binding protein
MRKTRFIVALLIVATLALTSTSIFNSHSARSTQSALAQAEPTGKLKEVMDRGRLICGVSGTLPGFSFLDPDTNAWTGFDTDYCRAVAAGIFGEATADTLEFVPLTAAERFAALQSGQIDVLIRNTTWTFSRDTDVGGDFGPTTFYDGQGMMVPVSLGVSSALELDGASICTQSGTTTELNITDYFNANGMTFELIPLETSADTMTAFEGGRCDVLTSDKSQLAGLRSAAADPSLYMILPETISKEPLGPMYNQGDAQWGDVVNWITFATFQAEELGVTMDNADTMEATEGTELARFLGNEGDLGSFIGLSNDFAKNVIKAVGNYGEIYDRNIVPIGIERAGSLNALWTQGGLIYAPAWR